MLRAVDCDLVICVRLRLVIAKLAADDIFGFLYCMIHTYTYVNGESHEVTNCDYLKLV